MICDDDTQTAFCSPRRLVPLPNCPSLQERILDLSFLRDQLWKQEAEHVCQRSVAGRKNLEEHEN